MKIVCPQCDYTREMAEDKMPSKALIATCPQCQHRFTVVRPEPVTNSQTVTEQSAPPTNVTTENASAPKDTSAPKQEVPIPKYTPSGASYEAHAEEEKRKAAEAYEKQDAHNAAMDEDAFFAAFAVENPWENPQRLGYISSFFQTIIRVLFEAPRFFAGLKPASSLMPLLAFYCLVGLMQIVIERFWGGVLANLLAPMVEGDALMQPLVEMLRVQVPLMTALFYGTTISIVELIITSGFCYMLFRLIVPQKADFTIVLQVVAYAAAPALLCIVPMLGSVVGFVWGVITMAVGCRYAMRLSWGQALMGVLPLYCLLVPFLLQLVLAR